jgi:CHASE1-domain containing sensor protein
MSLPNSSRSSSPFPFSRSNTKAITIAVACGCLALTLVFWQIAKHQAAQANRLRFEQLIESIRQRTSDRLHNHTRVLEGIEGLFAASQKVSREEFRQYVTSLRTEQYPGALGFGFIRYVPSGGLDEFLARTRADGAPDFKLHSLDTSLTDLFVIEFIEPLERNRPARGLDIGSEAHRREAATRAVETNESIITRRITLVQDEKKIAGFLILHPLFRNGAPTGTAAERWDSLLGWAYTPIRIDELLHGIDGETEGQVDFEIFDEDGSDRSALLFDADGHLQETSGAEITEGDFNGRLFHREIGFKLAVASGAST